MPSSTTGLIWDEATEAGALARARAFESAWKASWPGRRPDPADFVPTDDPARLGNLLAILRVDLGLRRRLGEDGRPEPYLDRFPELRGDALVALLYEDYCLREEAGEAPHPAEYEGRFPEVAGRLREIIDIHELVAEPGSTALDNEADFVPFPKAGETICGFRLVEELGRGSFARVFLARERELADRPVALKVSRTGSREPQTLARLQHTHIVPVHSHRVDPTTGLHLLCMPYFGRVTLARLLAEPGLRDPRTGADLVEALDRIGGEPAVEARPAARGSLDRRTFPRAVAWWGARMAEALQHAHDRGVLHRDVKPSNVLIAGDGMPMLLDFNLAREPGLEGVAPSKLGGTLAYMAPEHLEALAGGDDGGIDHRADLYSLGMVLAEALGSKPMEGASQATTLADSLTWLLDNRRRDVPKLPERSFPIPPALEAVVRRCLAPDPDDRYESAADLAVDLQAIADDAPLAFAREPWPPRAARWLRRNRSRLAVALPVAAAVVGLVALLFQAQAESIRLEGGARGLFRDGIRSSERGEYQAAAAQFSTVAEMVRDRPALEALLEEAETRRTTAEATRRARNLADAFFERAEPLRFALLGFVGDRGEASRGILAALEPFEVLEVGDWADRADLRLLDASRRARLLREVDDLLFFWVVATAMDEGNRPKATSSAIALCEKALRSTDREAPWRALRDWWDDPAHRPPALPGDPALERSAPACFRWYLLGKLAGELESAVGWLERAARLEPDGYWPQFALAFEHSRLGRFDRALPPCDAAVALRPDSPWARKNRARLLASLGRWEEALDDLGEALATCSSPEDEARVRLDRGLIRQRLGKFRAARDDYDAAIAANSGASTARDARRNLARLDAHSGATGLALARYDELIASDPDDKPSRRGRAQLQLRAGRADRAEADLDVLIASTREDLRAPLLAERAVARLLRHRPLEAEADALAACRLEPTARNAGLRDRARLALGKDLDRWPDRPDAFEGWPHGEAALAADLRAAAARLDPSNRLARAMLLSGASDHPAALLEADRLVADAPRSARVRLARARVRFRAGRLPEALADVAWALAEAPEDPELIELRGLIRVESSDFEGGLIDLEVAEDRGSATAFGPSMARALSSLGRDHRAAEVWSKLIRDDPLDAKPYLGLAEVRRSLGEWDQALAALEEAAALVDDRSPLLRRVAMAYASCLLARPDRLPRVIGLGWRIAAGRAGFAPGFPSFLAPSPTGRGPG